MKKWKDNMNPSEQVAYLRSYLSDPKYADDPAHKQTRKVAGAFLNGQKFFDESIDKAEANPTPESLNAMVAAMELDHEATINAARFMLDKVSLRKKPGLWLGMQAAKLQHRVAMAKVKRLLPAALKELEQ